MRSSGLIELDAVVAVARHRNFRAAALELGLSRSALSQAVAALEQRLGVRLFNRTTRSVSLTEAGERFVASVSPALTDIRDALDAAVSSRATPAGTLRINTAAGAARWMLRPIILEYLRRYPEMKVDIVTEGRLVDIVVDGFDAGVRLAEQVPQDMIAIPLSPDIRQVVVCAPSYLKGRQPPQTPQDLLAHRCIRTRMPSGALYRWEFERHGQSVVVDVDGPLTLDDMPMMLEAALAGVGFGLLTEWSVVDDIAAGRLVRVLDEWSPSFPGLRLYYPGRRHVPPGLRALIDLINEVRRDDSPA
jgi:DNA-binding transcriptional LysR family regulator